MGAQCFTQPLDLVKTRMQLRGKVGKNRQQQQRKLTSIQTFREIVKNEGFFAIYSGLSAGLLRQATYTTTRLGLYTAFFEAFSGPNGEPPPFIVKAAIAMGAGIVGAFVGTPCDVALIRMTSDGDLPPNERRNYKNVFNALFRIVKEEGIGTLWRGAGPTIGRAMIVNTTLLSSYSQAKEGLASTGYFSDGIFLHFCASMISGAITTIVSMPVDIVKTRIQNMKIINGKPEYSGTCDVLFKVVRNEGILALYKGITPYYARIGPHSVLTFVLLEQMNSWYKRNVLGISDSKGGGGL